MQIKAITTKNSMKICFCSMYVCCKGENDYNWKETFTTKDDISALTKMKNKISTHHIFYAFDHFERILLSYPLPHHGKFTICNTMHCISMPQMLG